MKTITASPLIADPAEFDVREIPCRVKHAQIFKRWLDTSVGGHFVLVNDHDPIPLRYQFEAQFLGAFTWEYLEAGPEKFRVKIRKLCAVEGAAPAAPCSGARDLDSSQVLDVRGLLPPEPLVRILTALESLPAGQVLRARTDREPCHLPAAARDRGYLAVSECQPDGSWITRLERA